MTQSLNRIAAMTARYYYILRSSSLRLLEIVYWPAMQMLVWGFTAQVISAMLDVAGWAKPWNTDVVEELDAAMALLGESSGYRVDQP